MLAVEIVFWTVGSLVYVAVVLFLAPPLPVITATLGVFGALLSPLGGVAFGTALVLGANKLEERRRKSRRFFV